jgi:hypothetical protein
MGKIVPIKKFDLTNYDPEKGLKSVAVSEAAEKHWMRAKDATKLLKAVKMKLTEQRKYILWRDRKVKPSQKSGGPGRGKRIAVLKFVLPDSDPGHVVAHRWRKALKAIEDFWNAVEEAQHRCLRICEQENDGTIRGTEGTGEVELYTPAKYIEAARLVLGKIDLDPASNEIAQRTVRAERHFTVETDGLNQEWHGRVRSRLPAGDSVSAPPIRTSRCAPTNIDPLREGAFL